MRLTDAELEEALNQLTIAKAAIQLAQRQPTASGALSREPLDMASRSLDRLSHELTHIRTRELDDLPLSMSNAVETGQRPRHLLSLRRVPVVAKFILGTPVRLAACVVRSVIPRPLALRLPSPVGKVAVTTQ